MTSPTSPPAMSKVFSLVSPSLPGVHFPATAFVLVTEKLSHLQDDMVGNPIPHGEVV